MLQQICPRYTVAVDIPSGIHAGTGALMGCGLKADVTVTFGYEKLGMALYPGREYCKRIVTADIGFPEQSRRHAEALEEEREKAAGRKGKMAFALEMEDLQAIPRRPSYSNKGTFGKVLIVAGSKNMGGAAYLSALASYRLGAGLVKVMTAEENRLILQEKIPEAVVVTYEPEAVEQKGEKRNAFLWSVEKECRQADCVILGPGLGQGPYVKQLIQDVLEAVCSPVILDADALNTIAAAPELTGYYTENVIITPHLGEMARLTGRKIAEIRENLIDTAREYALRYGITCVLKDAATIVADKDGGISVNQSGSSAMAKGGSGDVLTGFIGALIVQGMEEAEGARMGVFLHGLSGERAAEKAGIYSVLAHEIADEAGNILKNIPDVV